MTVDEGGEWQASTDAVIGLETDLTDSNPVIQVLTS